MICFKNLDLSLGMSPNNNICQILTMSLVLRGEKKRKKKKLLGEKNVLEECWVIENPLSSHVLL